MPHDRISRVGVARITWGGIVKRSVWVLFAFIAANLVTYWTSGYFQRESTYRGLVDELVANHPDVRLVFAGDSHFAVPLNDLIDVDPHGPAYSIAFGGDSLRESYAKLRYVLERSHTIDTLVVSADPHMFGSGRLESSNRSFVDWYFIREGDSTGLKRGWASALLDQIPLLNNDFLQYLRKAAAAAVARRRGAADAGESDAVPWEKKTEEQRAAEARSTGIGDHAGVGDSPMPYYWWRRILALAKEHHVKVIGARFPVHREYAAQVSPHQVAEIDAFLVSHGVEKIVDLRGALANPRDFEDEDHVNDTTGVRSLLPMLERYLDHPMMRQRPPPLVSGDGTGRPARSRNPEAGQADPR